MGDSSSREASGTPDVPNDAECALAYPSNRSFNEDVLSTCVADLLSAGQLQTYTLRSMPITATTKLKAELYLIVFLCLSAIAVETLSLCSVLRPSTESLASWFQRSGAITSIFSAFAQYRISGFLESIRGGTFAESWPLYHLFKNHYYVLSWVIAALTVWGAFVWGYGDLLFKHT
jgi:hypothetical protein